MVTVKLTAIYYHITAETPESEAEYRVRDDGWALYVKTPDGNSVGRVSFGTDSKRTPDMASAMEALGSWLDGNMAGV